MNASQTQAPEIGENFKYYGGIDKNCQPHGRGTLYEWEHQINNRSILNDNNCSYRFEGRFFHGDKNGKGTFYFSDGSSLCGTFRDDELCGHGRYLFPNGSYIEGIFANSELNGYAQEFDAGGNLKYEGTFIDNKRNGQGTFYLGDGSRLDGLWVDGKFDGLKNYFYFSSHLDVCLVGKWSKGNMKATRFYLKDQQLSRQVYTYSTPKAGRLAIRPLIADPHESLLVFVGKSTISNAGEGLFAKVFIPSGIICSFYNGVRLKQSFVDRRTWKQNANCITLCEEEGTCIDVPMWASNTDQYIASLGHKVNHSFDRKKINAKYDHAFHPRFGHIKCIRTIRDIPENEEIFVRYGYGIHKRRGPTWFRQAFADFLSYKTKVAESNQSLMM